MPIPITLSLLFVVIYIVCIKIGIYRKENPPPKKDEKKGSEETDKNKTKVKKGYGWVWWLVGLTIAAILVWGFLTSWGKDRVTVIDQITNSGTQVVIPKEIWAFRWITSLKSQDLSVEIVENRNGVFRAVLHDINGHGNDERVAGLTLRWEGENLLGTWTDYADGEGGNAYLYKANSNLWAGWWECNNGKTKVHIEMKRE